jgi:hypothetical protein
LFSMSGVGSMSTVRAFFPAAPLPDSALHRGGIQPDQQHVLEPRRGLPRRLCVR